MKLPETLKTRPGELTDRLAPKSECDNSAWILLRFGVYLNKNDSTEKVKTQTNGGPRRKATC